MKEALIYQKLGNQSVRCGVCQRRCTIANGQVGFCLSKLNQNGKLYALNYGLIQGIQVDPIEKKPFYHFMPGMMIPSIGSFGCNFRCKQCLNWDCSWGNPATEILEAYHRHAEFSSVQDKQVQDDKETVTPQEIIDQIKKSGYHGIAFTYNEPTIWSEYVLDVAKLAKKEKLFTLFVTNGSWTKETLDIIGPFIDATNIDFKGFSDKTYAQQGAFFGEIPQTTEYALKKHKIFIELTTLLIPGINDNPEELKSMAGWIVDHLGAKTPWHISQFDPQLAPDPEFAKIPFTSVAQLQKAAEIGRQAGLDFIYIWAPHDGYSQGETVCPKCGTLAIRRLGWQPEILAVDKKGKCSKCHQYLNILVS